jgi:hypothetical protein
MNNSPSTGYADNTNTEAREFDLNSCVVPPRCKSVRSLYPIQGLFEFCVSFCWSTVYSHVRPYTAVYRAQTTYEISSSFVSCFAGVTGQRRLVRE